MRLSELAAGFRLSAEAPDVIIRGLTADSRRVEAGFLFAALKGSMADGERFIPDAIAKGAAAILLHAASETPPGAAVPIVRDANPRRALSLMAAAFYPQQPRHIAAVTGTNGKTSVASFTRQIWTQLGRKAVSIGTLGIIGGDGARIDDGAALTTPDQVFLHARLDALAREGIDHLAIEASSHGLDQFRLDGLSVSAAAFTNLTRDHLDYHGTEENYFAAKMRLFREVLRGGAPAVIDADGPYADQVAAVASAAGHPILTTGKMGRDIRLHALRPHARGQEVVIEAMGATHRLDLPLLGGFQASNAAVAAALAIAMGSTPAAVIGALATLSTVPGRMEFVGEASAKGGTAGVYVDYAHTPDALVTVLRAIRPHTEGRLHVVFGCGGDRDRGKRPLMGAAAAAWADRVIVTDDNPRSEDPAAIRRAVLGGISGGADRREIADRREAIAAAVAGLKGGDILLIAGKGHETGQTIGGVVHPFDDRDVARAILAAGERVTS